MVKLGRLKKVKALNFTTMVIDEVEAFNFTTMVNLSYLPTFRKVLKQQLNMMGGYQVRA